MIRCSQLAMLVFLGLSVAVHAVMAGFAPTVQPVKMAGGAESSVTRLGNSFEDLTSGVMTPDAAIDLPPRDVADFLEEPEIEEVEAELVSTTIPASSIERMPTLISKVPIKSAVETSSLPTPVSTQSLMAPVQAAPPVVAPAPIVQARPTTIAALPDVSDGAMRMSARPKKRPKSIEGKRPKTKPREMDHSDAKPKSKGAGTKNATRGSSQGQKKATAQAASSRSAKAINAGNSAISNYPGQVMRRLSRQRKPRVNSKGTALISFSIAQSGSLANARLARSSGSSKLDAAALALVRRAGPFPKPPVGAKRNYQVSIQGR